MKNFIYTVCTLVLIFSCKDQGLDKANVNVDVEIRITYRDIDGVDLLDSSNFNSYDISEVKLYYDIEGEMKYIYLEKSDIPEQFNRICNDSCFLIVSINGSSDDFSSTTYLELSPEDIDTIYTEFSHDKYRQIMKVYYNGGLKYEARPYGIGPFFTVVK